MIRSLRKFFESYWLVALIALISACQHEADKLGDPALNKFSDTIVAKIHDYQDRRDTKSLLGFFNDDNPLYRQEAALAFASMQDTAAIQPLGFLLYDDHARVRKAAAYALGQIHDKQVIDLLAGALQEEDSVTVRRELIEALGKVVTMEKIYLLHKVLIGSEQEKEGLAWGIYRAGIRNVHDGITMDIALSLLDTTNSYETRLGAAHFFSRSPNLSLTGRENRIIRCAITDPSPHVRMAAAKALQNVVTPESLRALTEAISRDPDYRVRINSIRAMESFRFEGVGDRLTELLDDENINVAIAAADVIAATAQQFPPDKILSIEHWRIRSTLLGSALKHAKDKDPVIALIKKEYETAGNPYYKAGLLGALGNAVEAAPFITDQILSEQTAIIRTAGTQALVSMRTRKDFPAEREKDLAQQLRMIMETGDVGIVYLVSNIYLRPELKFGELYSDHTFLTNVKSRLSLPRDNEALQVLNKAIAFFDGEEDIPETENPFNHPVDWKHVGSIAKNHKVIIKTSAGDIVLRLLVEQAPATVSNFITLANSGYFDGKNFHRVVPNFVVQGGCHRGDGYGSEDYSIRSEFANIRYQEGSVGMASAGKDTEGTQWFITHSPTPHLDGRYTIFAQVEEGMDVVHKIEVGDRILEVRLSEGEGYGL